MQCLNEINELVIYGFGRTAIRNIDKLAEDFHISLIIDNDPTIHGKQYGNCRVQTFAEVKDCLAGKKIVIANICLIIIIMPFTFKIRSKEIAMSAIESTA